MRIRFGRFCRVCTIVMFLGTALLPPPAHAAALTVETLADTDSSDGNCSPREAIFAANNDADYKDCTSTGYGNDTISFGVSGGIVLTSALPDISDSAGLTINGGGTVSISGNSLYRIFRVGSGASLTLSDLTLTRGRRAGENGGAIYNSGSLVVDGCTIGSSYSGGNGGALYSDGTAVAIGGTTLQSNQSGGNGGAISSDTGTMWLANTMMLSNTAGNNAGALSRASTAGPTYVTGCTFSGNSADGNGGAVWTTRLLDVNYSTFSGNSAGQGGALVSQYLTARITATTFVSNTALYDAGAVLAGTGTTLFTNTTFLSNTSQSTGGAVSEWSDGFVQFNHCTFSGNGAPNGGGAIYRSDGTIWLINTILANSPTGGNCHDTGSGGINNLYNNIDDGDTCSDFGTFTGCFTNTDPRFAPPGTYGGPTVVLPLMFNSPAVDGVSYSPPESRVSIDQRGLPRPADGDHDTFPRYDIGAFEEQEGWDLDECPLLPIIIKQ